MCTQCIVIIGLEELSAKNKIGWKDGRIRLHGKTKIVDRCRHAFTVLRGPWRHDSFPTWVMQQR